LAKRVAAAKPGDDAVVLGVLRGGVPIAYEIARELKIPLDVIIVRKLGVPGREELGFGAIASGGQQFIDQALMEALQLTRDEVESVVKRAQAEVKRRETLYRGGRAAVPVEHKTVILADDGLATGSTMAVAVQAVRQRGARRVIVAAPVSSREACDLCTSEGASCVCLAVPEPFHAVGEWYRNFEQLTDEDVETILSK
jgi:predicted phosphoribosyltransferase